MPQPSAYAKPGPYITQLPAADEVTFQSWVKQNHVPFDPSPTSDYDMRGYYKDNVLGGGGVKTKVSAFDGLPHFPDTYKTPYHKTFSSESRYATADAPHWEGDVLKDKRGNIVADETPKTPKAPQTQSDPWEEAAKNFKPPATGAPAPAQGGGDDWKVWQQSAPPADTINSPGDMLSATGHMLGDLGKGALKSIGSTVSNIGHGALNIAGGATARLYGEGTPGAQEARGIQSVLGKKFDQAHTALEPANKAESIGKGAEQVGEFLVPTGMEKAAVAKLGEAAPKLLPLIRTGVGALSAGAVNKAQGGDFKTGAAMGTAGSIVGEGLTKLAPILTESALGLGANARRFGRRPGQAILDETTGVRPATIASQGTQRLGELNTQLQTVINQAGVRPQPPIRGLLAAPQYDVPLGSTRGAAPKMRPMAFRAESDVAPLQMSDHINADIELPQYLSGSEHPELSGRVPQTKGVLRTRNPEIAKSAGVEIPPPGEEIPYNGIPLSPSRQVLTQQMQEYASRNAAPSIERIQPLRRVLSETLEPRGGFPSGVAPRRAPGTPIPEVVSPEEALGLRRTVGDYQGEHPWTGPKKADPLTRGIRTSYGTLTRDIHERVPGAVPIDDRISSLIPGVDRAAEVSLNAPTAQRVMGRLGAHTGAATMGVAGAVKGSASHGVAGGILGGGIGLIAPELISSPTIKMIGARAMTSPALGTIGRGGLTKSAQTLVDFLRKQRQDTGGQE